MFINFFSMLPRVFIIAEIGVNHNGDVGIAKKLIDVAKAAGADAVKFQTFSAKQLVSPGTPKVDYQLRTSHSDESHYEMLKKLELSKEDHLALFDYCQAVRVEFISTPYDIDSARFLADLGVRFFKTASADLVDIPMQSFIASTGLPSIIATGMATLGEVEKVVDIYEKLGNKNIVLLHAVSNYPCSDESINLRSMLTLSGAFNVPVGFSDHSNGSLPASLSVALGARVIEKHVTLDRAMEGPDHLASSDPSEFKELVDAIRRSELILGTTKKSCQSEERQMAAVSRKSITLVRDIGAGEPILIGDIQLMRPGSGLGADFIDWCIGRVARHALKAGHQISFEDVMRKGL
jgi:N,N'-diacetyllegionaminate synthase